MLGILSLFLSMFQFSYADVLRPGRAGSDTIFLTQMSDKRILKNAIRVAVTVDPLTTKATWGDFTLFPLELQGGYAIGSGEMQLNRAKASILRAEFVGKIPVELLSAYRNLDRGIDWAVDLVGFRVPVKIVEGHVVLLPGLEMGLRHYKEPVDKQALHASFILEARAATQLIAGWLDTGILGKVRYDLDVTKMSGFETGAMGFLALLLNEKHELYARVYTGIEYQPTRSAMDLPVLNLFTGLGAFGTFDARH